MNVYGHVTPNQGQLEALDKALLATVELAEGFGQIPVLIGGDLKTELGKLNTATWLHECGCRDASDEPTCVTANSAEPRRVVAVVSPTLAAKVVSHRVDWAGGFPVHAAQVMEAVVGPGLLHREWRPGSAYESKKVAPEERSAAMAHAVGEGAGDRWRTALDAQDLDAMWTALSGILHRYHASLQGGDVNPVGSAGMKWWPDEPTRAWDGGVATDAYHDSVLLKRRLQQWETLLLKSMSCQAAQVEAAICAQVGERPEWEWRLGLVHEACDVAYPIEVARHEEDAEAHRAFRERRTRWHKWVRETVAAKPSKLFQYIRSGGSRLQVPGVTRTPAGKWATGAQGRADVVTEAWRDMWVGPDPDIERMCTLYRRVGNRPAFPEREPITARELDAMAAHLPQGKHAGADEWAYAHMRMWHADIWGFVAALFDLVELCGRWPNALWAAIVCMLDKGGTNDPLDHRPVVLLPCLYRLWARTRAKTFRQWQRRAGIQPLPGDDKGSEDQGLLLTYALAEGRATGVEVSAAAVDLSKAYDRMPLQLLAAMAWAIGMPLCWAIGMPLWLALPYLHMYSAPRVVKVAAAYGQALLPTHGLVPGCPAATDCMAVATWIFVAPLRLPGAGGYR